MHPRISCALTDQFVLIGGWIGPVNDDPPYTPRVLELWRREEDPPADVIVQVNQDGSRSPIAADVKVKQPSEYHLQPERPYDIIDANVVNAEGAYLARDSNIPTLTVDGRTLMPSAFPSTADGVRFIMR